MKKDDLKVGQTVYLRAMGNNTRYYKEQKKAVITKIGRTKFYADMTNGILDFDFQIDTGVHYEGNSGWKAYLSQKEIEEEDEAEMLYKKISPQFRFFANHFSLKQLQAIDSIINP